MAQLKAWGLRGMARRMDPRNLKQTYKLLSEPDTLIIDWVNRGAVKENWGDAVAPHIVESLSGRPVVNRRDIVHHFGGQVYTTIGSMLGSVKDDGFEVWGTGFITRDTRLRAQPGAVYAVRGPLTWSSLRDQGVPAPERFGDPAQLASKLFPRTLSKKYLLGVIPHFKERELPTVDLLRRKGARIIDICGGINAVCDEVAECEYIVSSSLHGLVVADSYGKPAAWVAFSDRPAGDGFKFRDYLSATAGRPLGPLDVSKFPTIEDVAAEIPSRTPDMDITEMLRSCPFVSPTRLDELLNS